MSKQFAAIMFVLSALCEASADDVAGLRCRVIDSEVVMSYSNERDKNKMIRPATGFVLLRANLEFDNSAAQPEKMSTNAISVVDMNGKRANHELMAVGSNLKLPEIKLIKLYKVKGGRDGNGVQVYGTLAARSTIEWEIPGKTKYEETIVYAVPDKVRDPRILIADKWAAER